MAQKWFKQEKNRLFFRPINWRGWLIIVVYLLLLAKNLLLALHSFTLPVQIVLHILLSFVVLTIVLAAICYLTSEKTREKTPQDNSLD